VSELTELLITPAPQIERVALAIARDAYPAVDARHYLQELDRLAAPLYRAVVDRPALADRASWLVAYLFDELGFLCSASRPAEPRCSYLNEVLERRIGTPVALAVVVLALGERVGLPVDGIAIGGQLFVTLGGSPGVILDLSRRGRVVEPDPLGQLVGQRPGRDAGEPCHAERVSARDIALRLLLELKQAHQHLCNHPLAMVVCDRLVDLTNAPLHYRDRGLHALALGAPAVAASDLSVYLTEAPDAVDAAQVRRLLDQAEEGKRRPAH